MAVIQQIKSWLRSLPTQVYKRIDEDASCDEALDLLEGGRDETIGSLAASKAASQHPSCYAISPLQRWLTPVMKNVTETGSFEADDLPNFSIDAAYLRQFLVPLMQRRLLAFITQKEIGGKLLLSGCLELTSSLCSLAGPIMLRNLMQNPSLPQVLLLLAASVFGTLCGRAKDQICRVQATQIAAMLKSGLYEKSLRLSVGSRAEFPAGTIINISSHDVSFFRNYFLKVHDLWSAILQILVIFSLVLWIMGRSCLIAFAFMFMLFASQSKANFLAKDSVTGYISSNDGRLKYYRDFLYNVKAVKIQSLEGRFMRKINDFRDIQLKWLRSYLRLIFCFFSSMNQMIPALTATLAFLSYWWADYELTVDVVFPVLALFDLIHQPAGKLSISVTRQFLVLPSLRRVLSLLTAEEDSESMLDKPLSERNAVEFDHAEISYPSSLEKEQGDTNADFQDLTDPFTLGPLNFSFPKNKLSIVVGPVGSGKSTLLSVLAGYLPASKQNSVRMQQGRVALCTQEPWIQSCSVRENILFMSDWDEVRYREVVRACCLEEDFSRWPAGDRTIVGEKGATLSGGQRARISLARAVYSQADLILLDDPLAAVDAYVGNCLFRNCIRKLQQTVILVTHQTAFLPHADYIVALHNGQVVEYGTRQDLLERAPGYAHSLLPLGTGIDSRTSTSSSSGKEGSKPNVDQFESSVILEKLDSSLHEAEERATGHVKADIYIFYFKHAGGRRFLLRLAIIFLFSIAVRVINSYWFVWWLGDAFKLQQGLYMLGYMSLTLGQAISLTSVGIFSVTASLNASKSIHASIMRNLFHARMSYFESQPIGRILNRLSSDMDALDSDLMNSVDGLFNAGGQITASVITILVSAPWLLVIMVPAMWFVYTIQTLYRVSARELRRLSSILDSPVVATLSEALGAASTIKAYHAHKFFLSIYDGFINPANSGAIVKDSLDTWVTTRAEFISAAMVLGCGILYVSNVLSPLQAGLALSTSITFTKNVYLLLWALIQLEVEMNSVERLKQYVTNIPQEPEDQGSLLEMAWPRSGDIEFQDVSLTYHADHDLALDHVSIKVNAGQKIGLVGRTGSGKTTLVSTLSRLVEILSGKITIDGVDIRHIPLNRLRSSVYVLPQEPFLFEGTLRENLDYNDSHTDEQLWSALELCDLSDFFKRNNSAGQNAGPFSQQRSGFGLNFELSSGGKNLSAGQTQLLCMARAVLRRPKILVIDEATASVDPQSDKIIQHVLQTEFSNTTILCIAHRIATLVWMDQIVVMEDGRVVEQGSPRMLLLQAGKDGVGESRYRKLMRMNGDGFLQEMILECKQ